MKKKKVQEKNPDKRDMKPDEMALANRDVFLFGRLDNEVAVPVIRRLLRLTERNAEEDINLYINSSGGNGYNADAIIAIMHSIAPKVNTICLGHALSGACEILASGTGIRSSYEFATMMFHQTIWEAEGDITNLEIQAAQGLRFRMAQIELLHRSTGQERERIRKDIERDFYLSAEDAISYGIIDSIIKHRPKGAELAPATNNSRAKKAPAAKKTGTTTTRATAARGTKASSTTTRTTKKPAAQPRTRTSRATTTTRKK